MTLSLGGGTDFTNTRAPSLRDLVAADGTPHGGFMHNATLPDLMAVIEHYNAIPAVVPGLDQRLRTPGPGGQPQRLNLAQGQKEALVAFLRTLTGTAVYTDPKYSDPFDELGELKVVVLPNEGMSLSFSGAGIDRTVTLSISAVPNVDYIVQSSIDMRAWVDTPVKASPLGEVTATLAASSGTPKCFYRVVYVPGGGAPPEE